jgi:integrase
MMDAMPRTRPPHLHRETTRHRRVVWYVRVDKGPRTRIRHGYGTPEFTAAYQAAVAGTPVTAPRKAAKGSLSWLVEQYRDSGAWRVLASATRRQRENIFKHVLKSAGHNNAGHVVKSHIEAGIESRSKTPSQARNFLDAVRGLFEWAAKVEHVKADPTAGVKAPPRPKTRGFPAWNEDDVARYERRWPIGTKERVWLDVLLYTGLRRGDAVQIGRQHVRDGVAQLRTEKSRGDVVVTIPILPVLAATLAAGPIGELAFICGEGRGRLTKESFGNAFSEAARAAGVKKSAHGVRKIGATRAAENGATEAELDALFGWERGSGMSKIYTASAERARLAKGAISKLLRTSPEQSIPAPDKLSPAPDKKVI